MRKYIFIITIVIVLLFPLWMYLFWVFTKEKPLKIIIVDKTVLNSKTQEHISLSWVLTQRKYVKENSELYDRFKDYYGFFPKKDFKYIINDYNYLSDSLLEVMADDNDMIYYADLYGIYTIEWFEENKGSYYYAFLTDEKIAQLERSRKVYGGLTQKEMDLLKKMKARKKLIITEFNTINSPTPYHVRNQFEEEFGMKWTGWIGRYFYSLDTNINKEIPHWLKNNYLLQHDNIWPFKKSGIAFVRIDDRIEILENETHLALEVPIINTKRNYMEKYDLPDVMKYPFWFDIIYDYDSCNNVVSEYELKVNPRGAKLLKAYKIPEKFPAVLEHKFDDFPFYYFAGDFCDNPITMRTAKLRGIHNFSWLFFDRSIEERQSFFWNFYRPLVTKIIDDYYYSKIENK